MSSPSSSGLFGSAEIGHELSKEEYERLLDPLRVDLLNAQFDLRSADFSAVVLVAGDDRPGCVDLLHALYEWMDARYIDTHVLFGGNWTEEARARPAPWRYWRRIPPKGRIGLFLGAWATHVAGLAMQKGAGALALDRGIEHIERFERALADDGTLVLKFWLHLPREVLEKRMKKARKNPDEHPHVEERDWELLQSYDEGLRVVERIVRRTNSAAAPWRIVESTDHRYRNLSVAQLILEGLTTRLTRAPQQAGSAAPPIDAGPLDGQLVLDGVDLTRSLDKQRYEEEIDRLQAELNRLFREARDREVACVMVFEGWDAAGKGGTIRRIARALPIGYYRVIPTAAPSEEELSRHYLWRFWRDVPPDGHSVIFDRSWYGRVLVERVEKFASEAEWRRAYTEINDFEENLLEHGIPVLKFWLHIDADEQMRRFEARARTPFKKYKLTPDDLRNREKWGRYARAVHDMVVQTSTAAAPWHLVPANDKRFARVEVLRTVCDRMQERMDQLGKAGRRRRKKNRDVQE
jgi:polyphosphate:AMP phosphotransferase